MKELFRVDIDGSTVVVYSRNPSELNGSTTFRGQKIMHPFVMREKREKKWVELVYTDDVIDEETASQLYETSDFQMKHDGSCGALVFEDGKWDRKV
jgi:hypothetical protein